MKCIYAYHVIVSVLPNIRARLLQKQEITEYIKSFDSNIQIDDKSVDEMIFTRECNGCTYIVDYQLFTEYTSFYKLPDVCRDYFPIAFSSSDTAVSKYLSSIGSEKMEHENMKFCILANLGVLSSDCNKEG